MYWLRFCKLDFGELLLPKLTAIHLKARRFHFVSDQKFQPPFQSAGIEALLVKTKVNN